MMMKLRSFTPLLVKHLATMYFNKKHFECKKD